MTSRFVSNLVSLLLGALLMADRFVFSPGPLRWVAFGGACAILVTTLLAFLFRGRGALQRVIDAAAAAAAGWLVLASLIYAPGTGGWMALGAGGACALLGLGGLIAHESITEHAVRDAGAAAASRTGDPAGADPRARVALRAG